MDGLSDARGDTSVVVDCPVCKRVIWAGTACAHGAVPPPKGGGPKEPPPYHPKKKVPRV